jgi:hypothetical protein
LLQAGRAASGRQSKRPESGLAARFERGEAITLLALRLCHERPPKRFRTRNLDCGDDACWVERLDGVNAYGATGIALLGRST